jgi:hypothetical protein
VYTFEKIVIFAGGVKKSGKFLKQSLQTESVDEGVGIMHPIPTECWAKKLIPKGEATCRRVIAHYVDRKRDVTLSAPGFCTHRAVK